MNSLKYSILTTTALLSFGWLAITPALGQAAKPSTGSDSNEDLQEIVVSASRIERPGFTAPTPTTNLDAAQITQSGAASVADVLNQVPAFRPLVTATSSDDRTFAPGANYADLRGFGSTRTLVLVNGERVVPEVPSYSNSITNQVDLNIIPTIAIKQVNVVTGGASAAWGSDAVAGVVDMTLYKHYDGLEGKIEGGISGHGDNREVNLALLGGTDFSDGRGHITVAGEFDNNRGVGDPFTRSWNANGTFWLAAPAPAPTGTYLLGQNYSYASYAPGGLITSAGPLKGTAFGQGGVPFAFPYGTVINGTGMFGGGIPGNTPEAGVNLEAPISRWSLYGYGDYDITDSLTAHIQVDHSQIDAHTLAAPYLPSFTILSGNPFIPASVQATMTANRIASFTLQEYATGIGRPIADSGDQTDRVSAGLNWKIADTWKADVYYEYGYNDDSQHFSNVINTVNAAQAINAVSVNGQIQCANTANGCAPLNLFGVGSLSQAALNFIRTTASLDIAYQQQAAAANIHGDVFNTWAGPVSLATGIEYRYEAQTDTPDAVQAAGQINGFSNHYFHGSFNVKEAYGEAVAPIAQNLPLIQELDLNGALRHAEYSTVGSANTWKYGATWNVTDDLLFRATRSRDIRAPNLTELNFPSTLAAPFAVSGQTSLVNNYNGGNSQLKPEVARSTTVGVAYSPSFVPGLHASVDYFDINLADAIAIPTGLTVVNQCALGYQVFCALETKSGGNITVVNTIFANISSVLTRGLDIELSYSTPLSRISENLPGTMSLRALGTYTKDLDYQIGPGLPTINHAGQNNSGFASVVPFWAPRFRGTFSANYMLDQFSGTLVANFISAGKADTSITTAQFSGNNIPSYVTFNLSLSYDLFDDKRYQLFGVINNLFDKAPPIDPTSAPLEIPTAPNLYDVIGRSFKVGVNFKF